jgi:hypothetical protein
MSPIQSNRHGFMNTHVNRRTFLRTATAAGVLSSLGDLGFLGQLPSVSAAEARMNPDLVQLRPEIEPLVRLLEETSRDRLLEEVASRVQRGLTYREVLAALMLAGVRNVQPRPVGFKFHGVLVIHAAHLASLNSPDSDRWLPILWAIDNFKESQARNSREGNWHMGPVNEALVPPAQKARQAFIDAMDAWDVPAADAAVVGLARSAGANEIFDLFCRYGARDFREIGHKMIYVANSWRTLQCIGWQHAEPVLRSLAYALQDHDGTNPAKRDAAADRPGRRNLPLVAKIRADWQAGKPDEAASADLLETIRQGSDADASAKVVELLNRGVAPQSLWNAMFSGACELLMRKPGIGTLHSVTATNAFHHAFQANGNDEMRRYLLLQCAAFLPLFRGGVMKGERIDQFEAAPVKEKGAAALEEIFATVSNDKLMAARQTLTYLKETQQPKDWIAAAQRMIFLKGRDAHDYKFSSAVLEDYYHLAPGWRDRYLAASVFWLRGSGTEDNKLVARARAALKA